MGRAGKLLRWRMALLGGLALGLVIPASAGAETVTYRSTFDDGGELVFRARLALTRPGVAVVRQPSFTDVPVFCGSAGPYGFSSDGPVGFWTVVGRDDRRFGGSLRGSHDLALRLRGQFSRSYKKVHGKFRVKTTLDTGTKQRFECDSGPIEWVGHLD
jgi:hypothetical protein